MIYYWCKIDKFKIYAGCIIIVFIFVILYLHIFFFRFFITNLIFNLYCNCNLFWIIRFIVNAKLINLKCIQAMFFLLFVIGSITKVELEEGCLLWMEELLTQKIYLGLKIVENCLIDRTRLIKQSVLRRAGGIINK